MSYLPMYICRKFSLILIFMLLLQSSQSQKKFDKVDEWVTANLQDLGGRAVVVLWKDGKIVYNKAFNDLSPTQKQLGKILARRNGEDPEEMVQDFTFTSRQRIASSSKWLSAALVMTFVDEGKLKLNDTIGKFLPVMTANGKGQIQIWQCLSHLTGIKTGSLKESIEYMRNVKSMDEALELLAKQPMEGQPGKTFHYSNAGLQIAGSVIEKISRKSFDQLFAERIAVPCNMKNTDFGKGKVALPAGGAFSTTEDYMNFLVMILNKGKFNGKQILSAKSIEDMQMDYTKDAKIVYTPAEAGDWGYGFGEWVMEESSKRSNSKPSDVVTSPGLFGSFPWIDTQKKYAGFLFTFNLKSRGRQERYISLKKLADEVLGN